MSDIFDDLYLMAEKLIINAFEKHGGYIDDWFDHGYEDAVRDLYTRILMYLVKKKYNTKDEIDSVLKVRALSKDVLDIIEVNDGDDFGFWR